jgi:hypothetical protein
MATKANCKHYTALISMKTNWNHYIPENRELYAGYEITDTKHKYCLKITK